MALKRPHDMMATFSMASMTDVIFLLLIFFMVTSTFVFPTALEVNLPQSSEQTTLKPGIIITVDAAGQIRPYDLSQGAPTEGEEVAAVGISELRAWLGAALAANPDAPVSLYADEEVPYGLVVQIINVGAESGVRIVLATRPTPNELD